MRGYLTSLNIFDPTELNSWADSPECFPFLHVRNAMPAPGWFQPQEKCLNRQQLAGFPLFPPGYQKNSEKIKMKFPTGFASLITSFEGGLDKTESKTQRSWMSFQVYLDQIWTPELIRLQGHAALFTHGVSCKSPPFSNVFPPPFTSDISWIHPYIVNFHFTKPFFSLSFKIFLQACPLPLPFRIYTGHNQRAIKADSSPSLLLATTTPTSSSWLLPTTSFFQNTIMSRISLKNTGVACVWF